MSVVTINEQILDDIAFQTRAKNGESTLYKPNQIPSAIHRIETPKLEERFLVENGEYYPHEGRNGISKVTVSVSMSFSEADEGKVVSEATLVNQTSISIVQNGSYDTTLNDEVVVDVPNTYSAQDEGKVVSSGALVGQIGLSVSQNGSYNTTLNDSVVVDVLPNLESISISANGTYTPSQADGFSEVVVNVSGGGGGGIRELVERTASFISDTEVSEVGSYAFYSYSSLKGVDFPNAENIWYNAFYSCSRLLSVNAPNALRIASYAFANCYSLESANFPKVSSIDGSAFYRCSRLSEINFPSVKNIYSNAFAGCIALVSVDFPSVGHVGASAFSGCTSLTSAYFPNISTVGMNTFYGCSLLSDINIQNVSVIESSAFYNCRALSEIIIPNVTQIGSSAFRGCSSLSNVVLSNISVIYYSAFYGCVELVSLYLYCSSVPSLTGGSYAFGSTPIGGYSASAGRYGSIFVPISLYSIYNARSGWDNFYSRYAVIETPVSVTFVKEGFSKTISAYETSWRVWIGAFHPAYEDFNIDYNDDELFVFVNDPIEPGYYDIYNDSALTSICTASDIIEEKTYYLKKRD